MVVIRSRVAWFVRRRRRIPFRFVKGVTYSWAGSPEDTWDREAADADVFRVGLRLVDGEELHLFTFSGGPLFLGLRPAPRWADWPDYPLETTGARENASRAFVELLSQMIGVPVEAGR
jgi:hypothetical protein